MLKAKPHSEREYTITCEFTIMRFHIFTLSLDVNCEITFIMHFYPHAYIHYGASPLNSSYSFTLIAIKFI